MAENDTGELLGKLFVGAFAVMAVIAIALTAIALVLMCGSVLGTGVGLLNYYKAFASNVRPERPAVT